MPPGWCTFAAINPERADYHVTPLDPALRARFINLHVRAERMAWLAWARASRLHAAVLELATAHDRFLEEVAPRTWKYTSDLLHVLTPTELRDADFMRDLLSGYLPAAWIEALRKALEAWAPKLGIDLYELVRSYGPTHALRAKLMAIRDGGKTDSLDELATRLAAILTSPELGVLVARGAFNLGAFEALLADLPGDQRGLLCSLRRRSGPGRVPDAYPVATLLACTVTPANEPARANPCHSLFSARRAASLAGW